MLSTFVTSCNVPKGTSPVRAPDSSTAAVSTLHQKIRDRKRFLDTDASLTSFSNGAAFLQTFHALKIFTVSAYHLFRRDGRGGKEMMLEA